MWVKVWIPLIVAALAAWSYVCVRYGTKLESEAFDELGKLKSALKRAGVSAETALTGDAGKILAAIKAKL